MYLCPIIRTSYGKDDAGEPVTASSSPRRYYIVRRILTRPIPLLTRLRPCLPSPPSSPPCAPHPTPIHLSSLSPSSFPPYNFASLFADVTLSERTEGLFSNSGFETGACQISRSSFENAQFAKIGLWQSFKIGECYGRTFRIVLRVYSSRVALVRQGKANLFRS